uniref:Uncharacterized protein n=1 Tax=Heliothis virescens TaxID=7102 RepID=A0A2A4JW13_HELVI
MMISGACRDTAPRTPVTEPASPAPPAPAPEPALLRSACAHATVVTNKCRIYCRNYVPERVILRKNIRIKYWRTGRCESQFCNMMHVPREACDAGRRAQAAGRALSHCNSQSYVLGRAAHVPHTRYRSRVDGISNVHISDKLPYNEHLCALAAREARAARYSTLGDHVAPLMLFRSETDSDFVNFPSFY